MLNIFRRPAIMEGLLQYDELPDALLLDVRSEEEYGNGHIPGSRNVPIQALDRIDGLAHGKHTPIFVYCHSGSRSAYAAAMLRRMGYTHIHNLGGMAAYRGRMERNAVGCFAGS